MDDILNTLFIISLILVLLALQLEHFDMSCLSRSKCCLDKIANGVADGTVNQEVIGSNPCDNFVSFFLSQVLREDSETKTRPHQCQ